MRLNPEIRSLIGPMVDRLGNKSLVAKALKVSWKTVDKWFKRRKHTKDRRRGKQICKVNIEIELFILALRNTFNWGTERIKKGLQSLPQFMLDKLKELGVKIVQGVTLSRTIINKILTKHKINVYKRKHKSWKFFRAEAPNILWQLDPKGPYTIKGKKYWWVICIDDYSRFTVFAKQYDHCPSAPEIWNDLKPCVEKFHPKKILTDNNPFREEWDNLLKKAGVESLHAHPYYPQDKGKVERTIRNFAEEFVYLIKKFPEWLDGKLSEFVDWFNTKRYHQGIKAIPSELWS